jgi:hypothetical protein
VSVEFNAPRYHVKYGEAHCDSRFEARTVRHRCNYAPNMNQIIERMILSRNYCAATVSSQPPTLPMLARAAYFCVRERQSESDSVDIHVFIHSNVPEPPERRQASTRLVHVCELLVCRQTPTPCLSRRRRASRARIGAAGWASTANHAPPAAPWRARTMVRTGWARIGHRAMMTHCASHSWEPISSFCPTCSSLQRCHILLGRGARLANACDACTI